MNREQDNCLRGYKPIQLGRRRHSMLNMSKKSQIQVVPIHRASSIHHLRKSDKPNVRQNFTYVDQNQSRVKQVHQSFRERESEVIKYRLKTDSSHRVRIQPLSSKKPLVIDKENQMTARLKTRDSIRSNVGVNRQALRPDQLRNIVKNLRNNERERMKLRLY